MCCFSNCKPRRIDHGELRDSAFDDSRQPEIVDETRNTYIAETIPTANLWLTTME